MWQGVVFFSLRFSFRPFVGTHFYHDGGDSWLAANAMDTTAGMGLDWSRGLKMQFNARWQNKEDKVNDERFEASISYDYDSDGRGLMLSASPSLSTGSDGGLARSASARVGYGLPVRLFADSGLATVSADLSYGGSDIASSYGFRFAGRRLEVDLSAAGKTYRLGLSIR